MVEMETLLGAHRAKIVELERAIAERDAQIAAPRATLAHIARGEIVNGVERPFFTAEQMRSMALTALAATPVSATGAPVAAERELMARIIDLCLRKEITDDMAEWGALDIQLDESVRALLATLNQMGVKEY